MCVDSGMKWTVSCYGQWNVVGSTMMWAVDCRVGWSCVDTRMSRTVECQFMQRSVTDFASRLHGLRKIIPVRLSFNYAFNCVKTQVLLNVFIKK